MIKTVTGPMKSGKSFKLIECYEKIENKDQIIGFKPAIDTRDNNYIKSRNKNCMIQCVLINNFDEIMDHINNNIKYIFIDEAQFLKGNYNILSYLSIYKDIDIYISGLNMTSEQTVFPSMANILAISDEIEIIKAICDDCGKEASYSYYDQKKIDSVLVGNEGYFALCGKCLKKRRLK